MSTRGTLRLATRGSALALRQAAQVRAALADRRWDVDLVEVETTGDQLRDELIHRLGRTGAFVRALDERVLDGGVDGAIHSLKDMPTEQPAELIVAGVPERGPPEDVLVTPDARSLDELASGAVVGTASLRRSAQVRAARPDLSVEPVRGNVDTRIEKLLAPHRQREHERRLEAEEGDGDGGDHGDEEDDGDGDVGFERSAEAWFDDLSEIERRSLGRRVERRYDALVLARAGLERIGLDRQVDVDPLAPTRFVPAPGQGALAVTAVDGTRGGEAIHDAIDHPRTRVETTVERVILAALGGGCIAPIGVHATVRGALVHATAQVLSRDGSDVVSASRDLALDDYVAEARELADDLADRGADDLVAAARGERSTTEPRYEDE